MSHATLGMFPKTVVNESGPVFEHWYSLMPSLQSNPYHNAKRLGRPLKGAKNMRSNGMVPSNHDIILDDDAYGRELYQELRNHGIGSPSPSRLLGRAMLWRPKHLRPHCLEQCVDCDIEKKKMQFITLGMLRRRHGATAYHRVALHLTCNLLPADAVSSLHRQA